MILDVESTCWERGSRGRVSEIIEIGAVRLGCENFAPVGEFDQIVQPLLNPILSAFCAELTGIHQAQVDRAPRFPEAFRAFTEWAAGDEEFWLLSWGVYDLAQIKRDCALHGIAPPPSLLGHTNLKTAFASLHGTSARIGLRRALATVGLQFEGRHHRGIDDARNIASLAATLRSVLRLC